MPKEDFTRWECFKCGEIDDVKWDTKSKKIIHSAVIILKDDDNDIVGEEMLCEKCFDKLDKKISGIVSDYLIINIKE